MTKKTEDLLALYRHKKNEIEKRLQEFREVWKKDDPEIFGELCFCLLTPQSKAEACDGIIRTLTENRLLFEGNEDDIRPYLKKTRFYKTKSKYLLEARKLFKENGTFHVKEKLNPTDVSATREWLVETVQGFGYKEASHFLRNVGLGEELAILDIHILRSLKKLGILRTVPKSLTPKKYIAIEKKLERFSHRIAVPLSHLDLLLWFRQTHRIFK